MSTTISDWEVVLNRWSLRVGVFTLIILFGHFIYYYFIHHNLPQTHTHKCIRYGIIIKIGAGILYFVSRLINFSGLLNLFMNLSKEQQCDYDIAISLIILFCGQLALFEMKIVLANLDGIFKYIVYIVSLILGPIIWRRSSGYIELEFCYSTYPKSVMFSLLCTNIIIFILTLAVISNNKSLTCQTRRYMLWCIVIGITISSLAMVAYDYKHNEIIAVIDHAANLTTKYVLYLVLFGNEYSMNEYIVEYDVDNDDDNDYDEEYSNSHISESSKHL